MRVLGLKKASKFDLFKNVQPKILIFEYFPKISSEMNFVHPFYPVLIPNTPYGKFLFFSFLFLGEPRGSQMWQSSLFKIYIPSLPEYFLMEASTAVRFFSSQKIGSDTDSFMIWYTLFNPNCFGAGQICPRFFIIKNKSTFDRRYHSLTPF